MGFLVRMLVYWILKGIYFWFFVVGDGEGGVGFLVGLGCGRLFYFMLLNIY